FAGCEQCRATRFPRAFDLDVGGHDPFAVRCLVGLVHHHALGEQARERLIEVDVAGRAHGAGKKAAVEQVQDGVFDAANILGHRHDAAALAVDHWNRTAPVTLARYAPVAQTKIDLAGPNRNVAVRDPLKPSRDLFLRFLYAQAVEKARIDHAAISFIGGIGDDE